MNINFKLFVRLISVVSVSAFFVLSAAAQGKSPLAITMPDSGPHAVAKGNDLYCAGFIQSSPIATANKIIRGQNESDKYHYAPNDLMYINMGQDKGVNVGDVMSVIRPHGPVKSSWSNKGDLGSYVEEIGSLEVINVKATTSAARVKWSCYSFSLGDIVQLRESKTSPIVTAGPALDVFRDPSGKVTGRIVMGRDGAENMAKNFVVYVDLGADDHVQVGDKLTIFRPIEQGNLPSLGTRGYGFQEVSRPTRMRKVVGEAVVLNVKEHAATVIITRNVQEIHTGDWVEIQ